MRRREASDGRVTLVTFGYNALTMEQTDDWIWRFTQRFNRGIEDRKKGREGGKENRKEGGRMSTHANARANTKDTSGSTYDDQSVAQRHVRTTKKEGNYGRKEGREEEEHGRHDHHRLLQQKRRRKQEDRQRQVGAHSYQCVCVCLTHVRLLSSGIRVYMHTCAHTDVVYVDSHTCSCPCLLGCDWLVQ